MCKSVPNIARSCPRLAKSEFWHRKESVPLIRYLTKLSLRQFGSWAQQRLTLSRQCKVETEFHLYPKKWILLACMNVCSLLAADTYKRMSLNQALLMLVFEMCFVEKHISNKTQYFEYRANPSNIFQGPVSILLLYIVVSTNQPLHISHVSRPRSAQQNLDAAKRPRWSWRMHSQRLLPAGLANCVP